MGNVVHSWRRRFTRMAAVVLTSAVLMVGMILPASAVQTEWILVSGKTWITCDFHLATSANKYLIRDWKLVRKNECKKVGPWNWQGGALVSK